MAMLMVFAGSAAHAASRDDLHRADVARVNTQYRMASQGLGMPARAQERHAELIGLDGESRLQVLTHRQDSKGTQYYRYQQTFRGVPIFGEQVVVTEANGQVRNLFGRKVSNLSGELPQGQLLIGKAQALSVAKSASLGKRQSSMKIEREQAQQMVYVGADDRARMAYVVSMFADKPGGGAPTRPMVVVDAATGAVIKQWDGLAHAAVGTGPGGNLKTGAYEYGTHFGYNDVQSSGGICTMSNPQVQTVNLNGGTAAYSAFSYACPRNAADAVNGAYSPLNDAHFFGKVVYDMYGAYLGVAPLPFQLTMRVHYSSNYQGAFWDGATMTFGDGGNLFYPMVSLDLSAHEVSHGFTERNSNLVYSGMSGAINEAFSDMAGEAAEYYLTGSNDFRVAEQITKGQGAMRYMDQPGNDGQSIDNASRYNDNLDVHYSSGVYNKAFFLLARTTGWNTKKAFQVFARANQLYWTSSSSFDQGACGVETAAGDLGYVAGDVTRAFSGVGVSCTAATSGGGTRIYTNQTPASIPDGKTLVSTITVAGRTGKAAVSQVSMVIVHPQRGELLISLVAPDGSSYLLKAATKNDMRENVTDTYTVDLSSENLNGAWKLVVQDKFRKNVGSLNNWSLEL
jgi:vibriolysin